MFNVYLYEKKLKTKQQVDRMKDEFILNEQKKRERQKELAMNYRKRVENFVINMLENPIVNTEYKGPQKELIREDEPEKYLKDAQVYIKGYKYEKDRIQETILRNQDLDYMPNSTVAHYSFRERETAKEIQPDMRFTAKTSLERIEQLLKDHMQSQVENTDFRTAKKNKHHFEIPESISPFEKRTLMAKEIAKNLLPSLHNKTHFQAAASLFNNCPLSLSDRTRMSLPNLHKIRDNNSMNAGADGEEDQLAGQNPKAPKSTFRNKKGENGGDQQQPQAQQEQPSSGGDKKANGKKDAQKSDQMEAFNPIESSKKVLETCNVIRSKNPKVKSVHMGQGHLISTLERSVSDVYLNLYNRDVSFPRIYA